MDRKYNEKIRNIAIIAHVDHGKTTLVDHMLRQSGVFAAHKAVSERVMDNLDLERERGITIAAKNCAVSWKGHKINIIDTPGHADFGGEVERGLKMVDGALLLVDASEGPLPQTRFVLGKALEASIPLLVVINKIDRQDARPEEVLSAVYDLFIDLDADERQIDFPVIYAVGREGAASLSLESRGQDLSVLFDAIIEHLPAPSYYPKEPFQMLVTNLAYSDYLGQLAIGRIANGQASKHEQYICIGKEGASRPLKFVAMQVYQGVSLVPVDTVSAGEIVVLAGVEQVDIGDTICTQRAPKALKRLSVDEPTIAISMGPNTSPFAGQDGSFVQSRKIKERLDKEALHNVAIQIETAQDSESFTVKGRGEFQLAILIETMRREGYELAVGRPRILTKEVGGEICEPIEHLYIDCEEAFSGIVTEKLSIRKGRMVNFINHGSGRVRLEFSVPSRSLIGFRSEFLTDTRGTGIMNSYLAGYEPYRGDFPSRNTGSLVSDRQGESVPYALFHLEPRGVLFIGPGVPVYAGMIIGEHSRDVDLNVNPCKTKKLTNIRAAGKDENILLSPPRLLTLEQSIEFIRDDELVEVTPKNIRLRKRILRR